MLLKDADQEVRSSAAVGTKLIALSSALQPILRRPALLFELVAPLASASAESSAKVALHSDMTLAHLLRITSASTGSDVLSAYEAMPGSDAGAVTFLASHIRRVLKKLTLDEAPSEEEDADFHRW